MKKFVEKFLLETLPFAAGCLNTRRNGTIYFGVGDTKGDTEYKHGEIVGFTDNDNEVKVACTDALRTAILDCFSAVIRNVADKCIGDPLFLRVTTETASSLIYVMEIDIEPHSDICESLHFEVNMAKCKNLTNLRGVKDKFVLYIREGSGTRELDDKEKAGFIKSDLKDYIKYRTSEEDKILVPVSPIDKPINKFRRFLCKGKDKLDKSSYPILVLGKPDKQKVKWLETMSFIKRFPFVSAVFDFDDESNVNGFSRNFRNENYSTFTSSKVFNEYSGNTQALVSKFNRNKTVWIFANGQADLDPPEPHLRNAEWQQRYVGVCDAVIFFSQHSVIPRSRAVVLIMLFSSDFDGVVDTFLEIYKRFKTDQILILTEEISLFRMFEEHVSRRVGSGISDLQEISTVGVKWKDIKNTVHDLVGYEDDCNFWLPSSTSGSLISINERFRDQLSDLELLNSKQCEGRKNTDPNIRIKFKNEKEVEFYKGNKVSWWNFYYESHVLQRHCFSSMKAKMESVLKYPMKKKFNVLTFNLEHEPGAGGSTLCRHILWSFRKDYKCAVVKNLTENTPHQIFVLWQSDFDKEDKDAPLHTQEESAKPVLILLDDASQSEMTYEEFTKKLNLVFRKETQSKSCKCLVCVCHRVDELQYAEVKQYPNSLTEILVQKLTDEEKLWMEEKNAELEKESILDMNPTNLLSFMVLRTNFNRNKIMSIVKNLMSQLDKTSFEFELMQFIALFTEKTPNLRRSTKVSVPLECCDDLYRFSDNAKDTSSWERILSNTLNILLVFEDKENAGGIQIRMAHPILAEAVLDHVLQRKKVSLCALTIDMLKSNLVKSTSRGRDDVLERVHQMLNRRMVSDDEKQTNFSLLIESIIDENKGDKEKGYENASNVLKEGFSLFINETKFEKYAATIAQTLARLHSKWKHFNDGIEWAKKSLELASKENRCYFLHTYGNVLKEQFQYKRDERLKKHAIPDNKLQPKDAVPLLKLILGALDQFLKAQSERKNTEVSTNAVLYSYKDAVVSINLIASFLKHNVAFPPNVDLKRYLIDPKYIPEDLPENWEESITVSLKNMRQNGETAFTVFERQVCFYTTFKDKAFPGPGTEKIHRTHYEIKKDYAFLLSEFCAMFGEDGDEPPDSLCKPEMQSAKDEWHRRRILRLQGNTYMNIFGIYGKFKRSKDGFNKQSTISRFQNIKKHFSSIEEKEACDLAVSVCINIALGLVGGQRDSLRTIIENCKALRIKSQVRGKMNSDLYDLACYFITVLMWPSKESRVDYDDELFNECLRHLKGISKRKTTQHGKGKDMFLYREENGRSKPTTQFFVANENESRLQLICHRFDVFFNEHQDDDSVWEKTLTTKMLKRVQGQVMTKGDDSLYQCIVIRNEKKQGDSIEIRQLRGKNSELLSEERVSFYLGFSMSGPIAYNIKPIRDVEDMQNI